MLSPSCDFEEFFEAVRGKRYLDVVYHAELEATEVERLSYRHKAAAEKDNKGCRKYADHLFFEVHGETLPRERRTSIHIPDDTERACPE